MPALEPNAHPLRPAPYRWGHPRLSVFSDAVARRLPGSWSAVVKTSFAYSPAYEDVTDRLWNHGPAHHALLWFPPDQAALLDGPSGERLVVLDRPQHPGQFLLAALAPPGVDSTLRAGHTPNAIAVSGDPVRATADIERRLLPRYRQAVEAARGPALSKAHRGAQKALADCDASSDSLCDAAGVPFDEDAYGRRQAVRDADAWEFFETFLFHGAAAIDHAKAALPALPLPPSTSARWSYQLGALDHALTEGIRIRDDWESHLTAVLDQQVGPHCWATFNDALHFRNAEGRDAITHFIQHAPVLHAIAEAEREFAAVRVAAARAHSTTAVHAPGSSPRLPTPESPTLPPGPEARPHTPGR